MNIEKALVFLTVHVLLKPLFHILPPLKTLKIHQKLDYFEAYDSEISKESCSHSNKH